jgi:hypothetical protein
VNLGGFSIISGVGMLLNISIAFKKKKLFHRVIDVIFGNIFLNLGLTTCICPSFFSSASNDVNIR